MHRILYQIESENTSTIDKFFTNMFGEVHSETHFEELKDLAEKCGDKYKRIQE